MEFDAHEIPDDVLVDLVEKGYASVYEAEGVQKIRIDLERLLGVVLGFEDEEKPAV